MPPLSWQHYSLCQGKSDIANQHLYLDMQSDHRLFNLWVRSTFKICSVRTKVTEPNEYCVTICEILKRNLVQTFSCENTLTSVAQWAMFYILMSEILGFNMCSVQILLMQNYTCFWLAKNTSALTLPKLPFPSTWMKVKLERPSLSACCWASPLSLRSGILTWLLFLACQRKHTWIYFDNYSGHVDLGCAVTTVPWSCV